MAHLTTPEVFEPGFESRPILTEDTKKELKDFTAEDVQFCLHLLAYNNTNVARTVAQLNNDYGIKINLSTLRRWVSSQFTQKYVQIQHELGEQINRKLSAKTVDIAANAAEATDKAVERGLQEIDNLRPNELSSAAKNYADVMSKNIEKAQLLTDKPTAITKNANPDDALETLRKLGLLQDAEAVEELEE